jgi:uroporphyrinogen-III synthase
MGLARIQYPTRVAPAMASNEQRSPRVAITADRRRDEQAVLLERLGFEIRMFPLLQTQSDGGLCLQALTERLLSAPPDYLIANTGYGMRTWFATASEQGTKEQFAQALSSATTIVARGAKALGELRKAGLEAAYRAPDETLGETVEWLLARGVAGKSVFLQLHGEPSDQTVERLRSAGAEVVCVPIYKLMAGQGAVARALVQAVLDQSVDAVTFTAAPQVQALFRVAAREGRDEALLSSFNAGGVVAACIGEVCGASARTLGVKSPLVPEHSRLGSLAKALRDHFSDLEPLPVPETS